MTKRSPSGPTFGRHMTTFLGVLPDRLAHFAGGPRSLDLGLSLGPDPREEGDRKTCALDCVV
jgi:hypothetical protein